MSEVVVGLDVHLKNTLVTVMKNDLIGEIVKRERISTSKADLRKCLESVPKGTKVASHQYGKPGSPIKKQLSNPPARQYFGE